MRDEPPREEQPRPKLTTERPSPPARGLRLLEPRHRFTLDALGATSFFDCYDRGIVTIALPQIRATFHLSQAAASTWIAVLFLGATPSVA